MSLANRLREPLMNASVLDKNRGGHGMFLRQPPTFSRWILWTLMITTIALLLWALFAKMEEVVSVSGKLEPISSVADVKSAVTGIIALDLTVREGETVKKGQILVHLDKTAQTAAQSALHDELAGLKQEYGFYQKIMSDPAAAVAAARDAGASEEIVSLAKDRASLIEDNTLLEAQMKHSHTDLNLKDQQRQLFDIAEQDRREKITQATLAAQSAEKELEATEGQLQAAERLAANARAITETYEKLTNRGGVAQIEYLSRQSDLIRNESQVGVLRDKMESLRLEISRAREEERNVETSYIKAAMTRRADNLKSLSEIDSRFGKISLETNRRLGESEAKLAAAQVELEHHTITAPIDGIVQEVRVKKAGSVVQASEPILRIVPVGETLVANLQIPNSKAGFIKTNMNCEIRVDTFPFREFGGVDGVLDFIGSDAIYSEGTKAWFYPARAGLTKQHLIVRGQLTPLQSGMSVSVNIHIRQRSVMSIFVDFLMKPVESLKEVR